MEETQVKYCTLQRYGWGTWPVPAVSVPIIERHACLDCAAQLWNVLQFPCHTKYMYLDNKSQYLQEILTQS